MNVAENKDDFNSHVFSSTVSGISSDRPAENTMPDSQREP